MIDDREGVPSASSMARTINCPGWKQLADQCPVPKEDGLATSGTKIHSAMETGEDGPLDLTESEITGRLRGLRQEAIDKWKFSGPAGEIVEIREKRIWLRDPRNLKRVASAKLDEALIADNSALILDFKSGFKPPTDAEKNWQIRTQVACLYDEFPNLTSVWAGFAASRVYDNLDLAVYGPEEAAHATLAIQHAVWASSLPDAARYPGAWCDFCPAKGHCREAAAYAGLVEYELGNGAMTAADVSFAVAKLSPVGLKQVWERSSIIGKIVEAVKDSLKAMPAEELNLLGLMLKPGTERRSVSDNQGARERLKDIPGAADFFAPEWTKLEEHIAVVQGVSKVKAKIILNETLKGILVMSQNTPSIAKIK